MNKLLLACILIFSSFTLLSQSKKVKELRPFVAIQQKEYDLALDSLKSLLKDKKSPDLYSAMAYCYFKQNKFDEALKICDILDRIKPDFGSELRFKVYLSLNEKDLAKQVLQRNVNTIYQISLFNLLNDEAYNAIYLLGLDQEILTEGFYTQTEKQLYQVERLINKGRDDQSIFLIDELLNRKDNISEAYYFKSLIAYNNHNLTESLDYINEAIAIKSIIPKYIRHRTIVNNELHNYADALDDINKLLRLEPYKIENYILKADLLFKTNQFEKADELTKEILELLPDNPDVLYLYSLSNYKQDNHFEALKAINKSLSIKTKKEYYELRGDIYTLTNTYDYAIRDYAMYLDLEPYNGNIYVKKGLARFKTGDKKGACSDWEKGKRYGSYDVIKYLEKYCK